MKRQKGFGLLELLFVLSILGVITAALTIFFAQDREGAQVSQAAEQLITIHKVADEYLKNMGATLETQPTGWQSNLTMSNLVSVGLVTDLYETDPWGGAVTLVGNSQPSYTIQMQGLPSSEVCEKLLAQIQQTNLVFSSSSCGNMSQSAQSQLSVTFNLPSDALAPQ